MLNCFVQRSNVSASGVSSAPGHDPPSHPPTEAGPVDRATGSAHLGLTLAGLNRTFGMVVATALLLGLFAGLLMADETRRAARVEQLASAESADASDVAQAPAASALRSLWVSQSIPEVVVLGHEAVATFIYRNIGSVPWVRGAEAEARLGIVGDDKSFFNLGMSLDWPAPDRLAVQAEQVVDVGETATFRFRIRGSVTGRHHVRVRPVVDGLTWMDDDGAYFDLVVSAG
jgi:hypothetical protein